MFNFWITVLNGILMLIIYALLCLVVIFNAENGLLNRGQGGPQTADMALGLLRCSLSGCLCLHPVARLISNGISVILF